MNTNTPTTTLQRAPRATYRLQFHRGFTLRAALELVPYLEALGISHVYASPLLMAMPGSTHGYDGCDFSRLNPEIGTEADLEAFVAALHRRGMGLVLDLVPNHMGLGADNPWWWDVLRLGQASDRAKCFDIDWESPDPALHGKVLVPVLGDEYDAVLQAGQFGVQIEGDAPVLRYFTHKFPLALTPEQPWPRPLPEVVAELNASREALDAVLQEQAYCLAFWRHGDARVNYRRFFNITTLAGLRVEDRAVFDAVHERVLDWHARGFIDGLRIDHIDGLREPERYLEELRAAAPGVWLLVEKILGLHEALPKDCPIEGTTGYDFMNRATALFINQTAEASFTEFYAKFTGEPVDYAEMVRDAQRQVLRELLVAEVDRLTRCFALNL